MCGCSFLIRRSCKAPCCHLVELSLLHKDQTNWARCGRRKPTSPQFSQSPQLCFLTLETTGHSLSCGPRQRRIRRQIKKGREGRVRIVWCESLPSLLRNVELWKWLIWLFDIWSMCFFFLRVHFSSVALPPPPFVMSVSGCRSSGPRGGYPSVSPRQAQPHGVSEERGQPANTTTQQ